LPGVGHGFISIEINIFIFHTAPQSFNKNVILPDALAIHADVDVIVLEIIDKRFAGILATLVRVEYFSDY
jgi:hypothetical protein